MNTQARKALGVGLALVLFGGGVAVGLAAKDTTGQGSTASQPAPAVPGPSGAGQTAGAAPAMGASRIVSGIPVGYPHTRSGALSAAATYMAALSSPAILTPDGRAAVAQTVASSGAAAAIRGRLDKAKSSALDGLRTDQASKNAFVLRTVPLSVKAAAYSETSATVELYLLTLMGSSTSTANSAYATGTMSLVWDAGDWKVASYDTGPTVGPIPSGFYAPSTGWQPADGSSLYDVSAEVRERMNQGEVPGYVVP